MRLRKIIFWTLILISIDQIVKVIINAFLMDYGFMFIPNILEFYPVFNDKHSYINALLFKYFQIDLGLRIHLISFLIIQIIILLMYDFLKSRLSRKTKILDYAIIFQLAAMICGFIGNLIWEEGTLDYVYLKPLFVFDLKDLYVWCFISLFLIVVFRNRKHFGSIRNRDLFLHFLKRLKQALSYTKYPQLNIK